MSAVVVAGLGYVGLPLAMRAVAAGHQVTGYDVDLNRVKRLEAGESYVEDVPAGELFADSCTLVAPSKVRRTPFITPPPRRRGSRRAQDLVRPLTGGARTAASRRDAVARAVRGRDGVQVVPDDNERTVGC